MSAADDDRTFVAAASYGTATSFYELRLSQSGKPEPLVRLSFSVPGYVQPDSVALSPDGHELAAAVLRPKGRHGRYVPSSWAVFAWSGSRRLGPDHPDQGPQPGLQLLVITDPV